MDKDVALEQIFDDLIFHETLNIIFDTHRAVKKGLSSYGQGSMVPYPAGPITDMSWMGLHLKLIDSFKDICSIMKNRQRLI